LKQNVDTIDDLQKQLESKNEVIGKIKSEQQLLERENELLKEQNKTTKQNM
jgi:hypothetical protein